MRSCAVPNYWGRRNWRQRKTRCSCSSLFKAQFCRGFDRHRQRGSIGIFPFTEQPCGFLFGLKQDGVNLPYPQQISGCSLVCAWQAGLDRPSRRRSSLRLPPPCPTLKLIDHPFNLDRESSGHIGVVHKSFQYLLKVIIVRLNTLCNHQASSFMKTSPIKEEAYPRAAQPARVAPPRSVGKYYKGCEGEVVRERHPLRPLCSVRPVHN